MRRLCCWLILGAAPWLVDPTYGARRNAYGAGVHMDATGRPYHDTTPDRQRVWVPPGSAFVPNGYGLGEGRDTFGRRILPAWGNQE